MIEFKHNTHGFQSPLANGELLNFKPIFEHLSQAILLVDNDLKILYLNPSAEVLLKFSFKHKINESIQKIFFESESFFENFTEILENNAPYTKRKANWQLYNGDNITIDYTVTPLKEFQISIFEIQALDRLLQISKEETMIANQSATRNLLRGLAHEVKNPLGGIRGAAQLLSEELKELSPNTAQEKSPKKISRDKNTSTDGSDLSEYTDIIIAESDRLRHLVDRMLGPFKPLNKQSINIHDIIERVILLIKAETSGEIVLLRDYDPSIPELLADPDLLVQSLLNITCNALEALRDSKVDQKNALIRFKTRVLRQFTIGHHCHSLVAVISVIDNGPGISKELIDTIFYPMISGKIKGSGLGLAISQQLVNQHNGLIECYSKPPETRFNIYLPL